MQDFYRAHRAYTVAVNSAAPTVETSTPAMGSTKVRLVGTVDFWVSTDDTQTAMAGGAIFVPARLPLLLKVTPGSDLSFIADSGNGQVNLTEMS